MLQIGAKISATLIKGVIFYLLYYYTIKKDVTDTGIPSQERMKFNAL